MSFESALDLAPSSCASYESASTKALEGRRSRLSASPSSRRATAAPELLAAIGLFLRSRGVRQEEVESVLGRPLDALMQKTGARVPDALPHALIAKLLPKQLGSFDFDILRGPLPSLVAPLEATASVASSVREILRLIVDFAPVISDRLEAGLETVSSQILLKLTHPHDSVDGGLTTEAVLWMFKRCVLDPVGVASKVARDVGLGRPGVALVLDAAAMDHEPAGSNPRAYAVLEEALARHLAESRPPDEDAELVRILRAIEQNADAGVFSVVAAAQRAQLSLRTAQRLLATRGSSLREEIDILRCEAAIRYVEDRRGGVDEIAARLGYSDSRAFRRAFQRWTGVTPSKFRRGAPEH
ncbi:MAG: AraC family transcriptional regulator [Myxococcota bacterium]